MTKEYATPGPRAIYPEICDSRSLGRCGLVANALWPRLIAKADDQGRFAGDASDVLAECFPKMLGKVTLRQVREALTELQGAGQVLLYAVDGEPYIQIATWWSWQGSQRRSYPSRHPSPEGWTDYVYGYDDHPRTLRDAQGKPPRKRKDDEGLTPSDDPDPNSDEPDGNGSGTAPEPHRADTGTAPEPHAAGTVPAPEPHRAAPPRAQPRVRGARPGPALPVDTTPQPPAGGGRRRRDRDLGPMRPPGGYQYPVETDDDVPWLGGQAAEGGT